MKECEIFCFYWFQIAAVLDLCGSTLARDSKERFWGSKIPEQLATGLVKVEQVLEKQIKVKRFGNKIMIVF